ADCADYNGFKLHNPCNPRRKCSILIRTERTTRNPTSTSAENCALGIEHWSDPRSDVEQWILPSYFCASPKPPTVTWSQRPGPLVVADFSPSPIPFPSVDCNAA